MLLLSTLILTGALAYQALVSVASQRATANAILGDYAAFAAEQYGERVSQDLEYYGMYPTLQRLAALHQQGQLSVVPSREVLGRDADASLKQSLELARYLFRFDTTGSVVASEDEAEQPPEWLGKSLAEYIRTHHDTISYMSLALLQHEGNTRSFAYVFGRDSRGAFIGYGFETDSLKLAAYFTRAFERAPLLPTTLTRGVSYDSVISVNVRMADSTEFLDLTHRSEPRGGYGGAIATSPLHSRFGRLSIQVSLDPAAAEMLIIGGLPTSRLPFVLGMFLLTAGLIAAALMQFRRERELDRLRTEFVSNVSHELRTPLAQIRMFAETLLLGRVRSDEEHRQSLAIMDKETRRLTHLVENILLFSRSERQTMQLECQAVELHGLLDEVVETFRPLAEARRASVTVASDAMTLNADPAAVRQIVLNLLDNAVKYGPTGQQVQVGAELRDGWARVTVEDEGPGIPEADRSRVWERFGRLERERKSSNAGTGIGLAVVRDLTLLHDGRAYIETGEQGGARFVIEIPGAERATTVPPSQTQLPSEGPAVQSAPSS